MDNPEKPAAYGTQENYKPWNVGSAERCILYMQVLTE
jgi:hypothetical protein